MTIYLSALTATASSYERILVLRLLKNHHWNSNYTYPFESSLFHHAFVIRLWYYLHNPALHLILLGVVAIQSWLRWVKGHAKKVRTCTTPRLRVNNETRLLSNYHGKSVIMVRAFCFNACKIPTFSPQSLWYCGLKFIIAWFIEIHLYLVAVHWGS